MQRRSIPFALLGAALVPAAALAQGSAPPSAATPQSNTPPADLGSMRPEQLTLLTHEAGAFSLATARLGMERASNAEVKRFANFEVREQEGVAQAMKLAGHNLPEPRFSGEKAQILQRLQGAEGAEFERMFLQIQEQGHQELLNLTTAITRSAAMAPDKIIALLASDRIQEHLIDIGSLMGRR